MDKLCELIDKMDDEHRYLMEIKYAQHIQEEEAREARILEKTLKA